MDPKGIRQTLAEMNEAAGRPQPVEIRNTPSTPTPESGTSPGGGGGIQIDQLFEDDLPIVPETDEPILPTRPRPSLDAPTPERLSPAGSMTVS
jgi:hypothetical protein